VRSACLLGDGMRDGIRVSLHVDEMTRLFFRVLQLVIMLDGTSAIITEGALFPSEDVEAGAFRLLAMHGDAEGILRFVLHELARATKHFVAADVFVRRRILPLVGLWIVAEALDR
jgi:hypothetical protein